MGYRGLRPFHLSMTRAVAELQLPVTMVMVAPPRGLWTFVLAAENVTRAVAELPVTMVMVAPSRRLWTLVFFTPCDETSGWYQ